MLRIRKVFFGVLVAGLVVAACATLVYRQRIIDQIKVWSYQPSQEIIRLAQRSGFSDEGRFYFYATHPRLEKASAFNEDCRRVEQGNPVLGCYNQGTDTIYIYNVENSELDGVREVTAAHEMLHAAFARLSETRRTTLARSLEEAYARVKTDELEKRMAYYDRNSTGSRINELHSILGTEFADLEPELERYYRTYFTNRQNIVSLHTAYRERFQGIERELTNLAKQLEQQKAVIDADIVSYDMDLKAYNEKVKRFNARAASGDFASQEAFSQERSNLIVESATLENRRVTIERATSEYNEGVNRYNSLGGKMNQLNSSLDSLREVSS